MLEPLRLAPLGGAQGESAPWQLALGLAQQAVGLSNPNPYVGCVITNASGEVIGQGHTQRAGSAHAEVMALSDAHARGHDVVGARVFVTLEPCSHHGRTPPCCEALIAARVGQVQVASIDPNPLVAGKGIQRLRAAGIEVVLLPPLSATARAARSLNVGFFSRMIRRTPWLRMKTAASLDGVTALDNGRSQWITGPAARADGHAWRARACAVLTGVGTVIEDDPMLDVRLAPAPRQPDVVVVDSRLQIPLTARLFGVPNGKQPRRVWVYCATSQPEKQAAIEGLGAQVVCLPDASGKVDLSALLQDLARREINELHIEAGHKLNGSFLRAGLIDECLFYLAPTLLGLGLGVASFGPLEALKGGVSLGLQSVDTVGADLRIVAGVTGRADFLHPPQPQEET